MKVIIFILTAYLLGSVPFGLLVGKVFFKKDIRQFGSGNIGATNTFRILGRPAGTLVFLFDLLKGALPVAIFVLLFKGPHGLTFEVSKILIGTGALIGHTYSTFLGFSGGKGVATGLGIIFVLSPQIVVILLVVWLVVVVITRYISLSSIIAVALFPILVVIFDYKNYPLLIFSFILAFLVIYKHRSNIKRIIKGTEYKIWS